MSLYNVGISDESVSPNSNPLIGGNNPHHAQFIAQLMAPMSQGQKRSASEMDKNDRLSPIEETSKLWAPETTVRK